MPSQQEEEFLSISFSTLDELNGTNILQQYQTELYRTPRGGKINWNNVPDIFPNRKNVGYHNALEQTYRKLIKIAKNLKKADSNYKRTYDKLVTDSKKICKSRELDRKKCYSERNSLGWVLFYIMYHIPFVGDFFYPEDLGKHYATELKWQEMSECLQSKNTAYSDWSIWKAIAYFLMILVFVTVAEMYTIIAALRAKITSGMNYF